MKDFPGESAFKVEWSLLSHIYVKAARWISERAEEKKRKEEEEEGVSFADTWRLNLSEIQFVHLIAESGVLEAAWVKLLIKLSLDNIYTPGYRQWIICLIIIFFSNTKGQHQYRSIVESKFHNSVDCDTNPYLIEAG